MPKTIINEKNIFFLKDIFSSQQEIFQFIAQQNDEEIASIIIDRLEKREKISTTGFGNGVAIPHAQIPGLKEAKLLMLRLNQAINWNALDDQPVNLIFCILVPENNGDEHLEILGNLASLLMDEPALNLLKTSLNKTEILALLLRQPSKEKPAAVPQQFDYLAVSACTFGLAHTYLVEERLKQYAKAHDFQIKVETHGHQGDLNILSPTDLAQAKGVILAVDKSLDLTHIQHQNIVRVRTTDVLKNPDKVFEKLKSQKKENKYWTFLKLDLFKHLNVVSGNVFNIYFVLGALVGLSLYIISFSSMQDNSFFNTLIDGSQYLALLVPSFLLAFFINKIYQKNYVFTLAIFAISASLTEYNYVVKGTSSYGVIGLIISLAIVVILMSSLTYLNKKAFHQKAKPTLLADNFYYGFKFWINLMVPLTLFVCLFYSYADLAKINAGFYQAISNANENWWFRWIIASFFLLGIAWDSGGMVNKWTLMISGFLFYDSFAYNAQQIWMTPITATAMGIILPCTAAWVRGKLSWRVLDAEEKQATKAAGIAVMRSISEGFLYFKQKYGWKTLLAHILTSLVVGGAIGTTNLQFFGGMNNLFSLLFSFSIDDCLGLPNLMYLIILTGGSLVGGIIHLLCYWPLKRSKNEKMEDSLYSPNPLG